MNYKLCNIFLLLLLSYAIHAQEQKSVQLLADECFSRNDYLRAALLYKKMAGKKDFSLASLKNLATCYRKTNQYAQAAVWSARVVQNDEATTTDWLNYGDMLKCLGKYAAAQNAYSQCVPAEAPPTLRNRIAGCDSAISWLKQPTAYQVYNMTRLNTAGADWGAQWYIHDSLLFVSDYVHPFALDAKTKVSNRSNGLTGQSFQKIYLVDTTAREGLGTIRDFTPVINRNVYHNGPIVFTAGYDTAYVTVTDAGDIDHTREEKTATYGTRRLQLVVTVRKKGEWTNPIPFAHSQPAVYNIGNAALDKTGTILYFTSDMPGGQGKTDIWYCEKMAGGNWNIPHNCGPVINTAEEEDFPTVMGDTLYFSSKGHTGMGGFDLFQIQGARDTWQQPRNLGAPLNSPGDDFYFISRNGYSGFISSNRAGGKGNDDIYYFYLPAR